MGEGYSPKKCCDYWDMWHERILMFEGENIQSCIIQSYIAWNVLYLVRNREKMSEDEKIKFKADIRKYFLQIFNKPFLFGCWYSIKLAVKCALALGDSRMLIKRYL